MGFFTGLFAFFTGFIVLIISGGISRLLKEKMPAAICFGVFFTVVAWVIGKFSAKVDPTSAMFFLLLGSVAVVILAIRWLIGGSTIKECIAFSLLDLLLMLTNLQAAARIYDLSNSAGVRGVVMALPKVLFLISVMFFILNMMWFKDHLEKATPEELDEDMEFYDNPLKILNEEYIPLEDEAEKEEEESVEEKVEKEEVDDEEPIDFGFLDGYDEEEGGYEDVEYAS